jgi:HNH endonuclease
VYCPETDDGGVASRGVLVPDDTTAVKAGTGIHSHLPGRAAPHDDDTIRKGSPVSVPDRTPGREPDTPPRVVHPLSVYDYREWVDATEASDDDRALFRQYYADRPRMVEVYARARAQEMATADTAMLAANLLLDLAADLGWGSGVPYYDALHWVQKAAAGTGRLPAEDVRKPSPKPVKPTTAHNEIHRIAAAHGGWLCYLCEVHLVDICDPDQVQIDATGGFYIPDAWLHRMPQREHVVPRAMGGSNGIANLRLACRECNHRKGAA